jgi:nicotinamidase-related amidase
MKTLIVVDMQNDFIDGSLANPAAAAIVSDMAEYIKNFDGQIIFTRDTHYPNYMETQEGRNLPIMHCQYGSEGWEIQDDLFEAVRGRNIEWSVVDKNSFGDTYELEDEIDAYSNEIYLCGTCTDICVISVALNLKARFPEIKMYCIADLCAGLTPEKHAAALEVMRSCQIEVI